MKTWLDLIREFFDGVSIQELRQLTKEEREQLAEMIAKERGLTKNILGEYAPSRE